MTITLDVQSEKLDRIMPSNVRAEQMLLGTLLVDNRALNKVSDFLLSEHFFEGVHQRIYAAIYDFHEKGITASSVTLKNMFEKDEGIKALGGISYLSDLAELASTIINATDYGKMIYDLALRRKLIDVGEEVVNDAFDNNEAMSAYVQIEKAEQKLYNVANDYEETNRGFLQIKSSLNEAVTKMESAFKNKGKVSGIATDFIDLDELLGGLQNSDLVIIAGRPAMGKTALAINIAMNCTKSLLKNYALNKKDSLVHHAPKSVGFFSLEMASDQIASRMISMISNISTPKLRSGFMDREELSQVMRASKELQELPFFIDDTPSLTISAIRTRARRLKRKHNLGLLIVDYLQLIRGSIDKRDLNRVQEVSEVTQGLKAIAKELDIPVVALSQLSRAVEQREDKKPLLSDLRESGSIEQDADIVAFIYRASYYLMQKKPSGESEDQLASWQQKMNKVSNLAEIIIAKHRNGPVGEVELHFDVSMTKFSNLAKNQSVSG